MLDVFLPIDIYIHLAYAVVSVYSLAIVIQVYVGNKSSKSGTKQLNKAVRKSLRSLIIYFLVSNLLAAPYIVLILSHQY